MLREPGIGGTCPECGELHASDAHYCSRCGEPLDAKARARRDAAIAAAAQPATGSQRAEPRRRACCGRAGRAQGARGRGAARSREARGGTSDWLATDQPTTLDEPAPGAEAREQAAQAGEARVHEARRAGAGAGGGCGAPDATESPKQAETPNAADEPKTARRAGRRRRAEDRADEPKPEEKPATPDDSAANGRRDERVPRPVTSGDPLSSPREQA